MLWNGKPGKFDPLTFSHPTRFWGNSLPWKLSIPMRLQQFGPPLHFMYLLSRR